ncbi:hypothetical protein CDCA_CDCA08G2304 [Cyanidium caldarium]|uniref:DNA helicase n=1 Tax=Cyanidium caldarium TaxID=2771 RepID=A0AAV9IVG6_CYACA|nr:hypothetical protein CDCA_CDCA08G2304 [Cyanidium caldarium]
MDWPEELLDDPELAPFDTVLPSEYVAALASFLVDQYREEVVEVLEATDGGRFYALRVHFMDLACYHGELAAAILAQPIQLLPLLDDAVREAQTRLLAQVDADAPPSLWSFKPRVHVRLDHLPQCPEVYKSTLSGLRASDIHHLIAVSGTVIRTGAVMMREKEREYECAACGHRFVVRASVERSATLELPPRCPSFTATATTTTTTRRPSCGRYRVRAPCRSGKFVPVGTLDGTLPPRICGDYQEIKLQESVHRLALGSIPRSIVVVLADDLTDACKAGDDVIVNGVLRRRWLRPPTPDARCDIELVFEAVSVQLNNEKKAFVEVSAEVAQHFEAYWCRAQRSHRCLEARDAILRAVCPQLYGMYFAKLVLLLSLIGGVPQCDASGTRVRGESHLLLVGDPGTGKSQLLQYAARLSPRAVITTGVGTTSAGLTVTAVREAGTGEWALEAGALVLADGGLCCIDEFGSIREHDRATIHEAMEQQTISVAKAGLVCRLNTRATVFAATNPKTQRLAGSDTAPDTAAALSMALGVASPLLSRFDVVLTLADAQDDDWDARVAAFILDDYPGAAASVSDASHSSLTWTLETLQQYVHYVKSTLRPKLTRSAERLLGQYYAAQRASMARNAARTTVRLLESLVRLSQAHARLMFRRHALVQDAIFAIAAVEGSSLQHTLLGRVGVWQSEFPGQPYARYVEYAREVLTRLGLEREISPDEGMAGGVGGNGQESVPSGDSTAVAEATCHARSSPVSAGVRDVLQAMDFSAVEGRLLADASLGSWAASGGCPMNSHSSSP